MQSPRVSGPAIPAIDPVDIAAVGECRCLRIVARIADVRVWESAAARLLDCGCRRWRGRPDIADQPALRRWVSIQRTQVFPEQPCLRTLFSAVAADREIGSGDACVDFAAAVMLLSSCPAEAIAQPVGKSRTVRFSVYAYREDDLPLADDLITTTVRACGVVLARRCAVLRRAPAQRPEPPLVDHPLPEPFVVGGTAAR